MAEDVLTVDQAAEFLQMHPHTVRRLLREGKLPGRRLGEWRLLRSELVAYISAGEPAKPEPKKRVAVKRKAQR